MDKTCLFKFISLIHWVLDSGNNLLAELFLFYINSENFPKMWKTSCFVPVSYEILLILMNLSGWK